MARRGRGRRGRDEYIEEVYYDDGPAIPLRSIIIGIVVLILALFFWKRHEKKQKRRLAGLKGARTRKRNQTKGLGKAKTNTRRKTTAKRKTGKDLKGSTTVLRLPSSTVKRARVKTMTSRQRMKRMHEIARKLQKDHPKSKYSTLLKMASKQL